MILRLTIVSKEKEGRVCLCAFCVTWWWRTTGWVTVLARVFVKHVDPLGVLRAEIGPWEVGGELVTCRTGIVGLKRRGITAVSSRDVSGFVTVLCCLLSYRRIRFSLFKCFARTVFHRPSYCSLIPLRLKVCNNYSVYFQFADSLHAKNFAPCSLQLCSSACNFSLLRIQLIKSKWWIITAVSTRFLLDSSTN